MLNTKATIKHPAKYTDSLIPVFEGMLAECKSVLDPFAGTGKIHSLTAETTGVEIEKEWADMSIGTVQGDSTRLSEVLKGQTFDAICTSPTYGNRMADSHIASDSSKRNTYTHTLGRKLHDNNSGKMQWGDSYRTLHEDVYSECVKVLNPGGVFVLNVKNHIRKGVEVDVFGWHLEALRTAGFVLRDVVRVYTSGNGFGQNASARVPFEYVAKLEMIPRRKTPTNTK
tara:strand:+ start:96 stop:776 length:681 start_codon:yes stop_codon:yes gene_type:complete